jgi:His/Glu/Gln/Arg/opine family amino acid ABC transporter permease subunit
LEIVLPWLPRLGNAALLTVGLFLIVALLSGITGLTMALVELSHDDQDKHAGLRRLLGRLFALYSGLFRGIPELVVLLICFLGLPQLGIELGPVQSAVLGFWLVGGAYDYQVFRGALSSVPRGQFEAGRSLGLTPWQVLRLVVIPQMARIALGPWATYATGALKRMSIASAVSVSEVMYVTKQAISATGKPFEFIFLAFALYAGISSILLGIEVLVARRMDGLHRAPSTPAIV